MSREIKFRAWAPFPMLKAAMQYQNDTPYHEYFERLNAYSRGEPAPVILMQSTGMKDKDGRLIFEGDIVRQQEAGEEEPNIYMGFVGWNPVNLCWGVFDHPGGEQYDLNEFDDDNTEVIGNIHENPEILSP